MAQETENRYSSIAPSSQDEEAPDTAPIEGDDERKRRAALKDWVMSHVTPWREYREQNFDEKWNEYYRLWRGVWNEEDTTRKSERSRLIVPALQQAVEATVAELEEATFGRGHWVEVADDTADEQKDAFEQVRDRLIEDYKWAGVEAQVAEVYLNSALYGTGIAKINVETRNDVEVASSELGELTSIPTKRVSVSIQAINPRNFCIDTSARNIDEALGMAHEMITPAHIVIDKMKAGIYRDVALGSWEETEMDTALGEISDNNNQQDRLFITEYHGMVPVNLLPEDERIETRDNSGLVEAIITIANEDEVIKEVANPFTMGDRCFLAYQHDTVPDRFWGRGICEKGYNPQKALDAELRARIDGLALTVHPMMAYDATMMPRGADLRVRPGKSIATNGDPNQVLRPLNFGTIDPNIFRDSADLERMVQMGTGAMDSAAPTGVNPRNQTASGMSMIMSGAIKRSKRTLQNITRNLLDPWIKKSLWRYMQFDEDRYPVQDYKFVVVSALGIVAREFEHAQWVQLLQTVPPASPAYWMVLRNIFALSAVAGKEGMIAVIDQMLQQTMQPPPEPQPNIDQQIKVASLEQDAKEHDDRMALEEKRIDTNVVMDLIK